MMSDAIDDVLDDDEAEDDTEDLTNQVCYLFSTESWFHIIFIFMSRFPWLKISVLILL